MTSDAPFPAEHPAEKVCSAGPRTQYTFSKRIISHLTAPQEAAEQFQSRGPLFCTDLYSYYFKDISAPLSDMGTLLPKAQC